MADEKVSSPATVLVGKECALTLNDGTGPFKQRSVTVVSVDAVGISYKWEFRGTPRDDFAPWTAVHRLAHKVGPSKDNPPKEWKNKYKKTKPGPTGLALVGKTCDVVVRSLGRSDETRNTEIRGLVLALDAQAALLVHNDFGNVFVSAVGMPFIVNVEYREKKDTKPPGAASKA